MKYFLILTLVIGCASPFKTLNKRDIASEDYSQAEIYLGKLVSDTIAVYAREDHTIDMANSPEAIQFTVNYKEADRENIFGMAGIRKRNIQVLLNEQYISWQQKEAANRGHFISLEETKTVIVRFNEVD